jgi:alpha/beta superfamily hydrolase
MFNPLLNGISDRLAAHGMGVLRFQVRGVGESGGGHGAGVSEVSDVAAAVAEARRRADAVFVGGWSFGAAVALSWIAANHDPVPYVGIAPYLPLAPDPASVPSLAALIIAGTRDQVVSIDDARRLANGLGAALEEIESDHFFVLKEDRIADAIIRWVERTTAD